MFVFLGGGGGRQSLCGAGFSWKEELKLFNKNHYLIFLTEMIFVQLPARSWPVCPCQCPLSGSQASPCRSLGLPALVRSQILISAAICLFLLLPCPLQLLVERSRSLAVSRMQVGLQQIPIHNGQKVLFVLNKHHQRWGKIQSPALCAQ